MEGKGRGSSFRERVSHTYTLRLGYSINFILYPPTKKKKKKDIYYTIYLTRAKIFGRLRVCLNTGYCLKIEKLINENIVAK